MSGYQSNSPNDDRQVDMSYYMKYIRRTKMYHEHILV